MRQCLLLCSLLVTVHILDAIRGKILLYFFCLVTLECAKANSTTAMPSKNRVSIALYRSLLRSATAIQKYDRKGIVLTSVEQELNFNPMSYSLDIDAKGKWERFGLGDISKYAEPSSFIESDDKDTTDIMLLGRDIKSAVRKHFKNNRNMEPGDELDKEIDMGFKSLSYLSLLTKLSARSSVHVTENEDAKVRVIVSSLFRSKIDASYQYFYRIRVENIGEVPVQLVGRHWVFRNSNEVEVSVVPKFAKGVVGNTPVIQPATGFQYMSQCFLNTQSGDMSGCFLFKNMDGDDFEAEIAMCPLLPM